LKTLEKNTKVLMKTKKKMNLQNILISRI